MELCNEIIQRLKENNETIALAESCTGGLCTHKLSQVPNASHVLLGGIICYSPQIKQNILSVQKSTIENYTTVSRECAKEMAVGIQNLFQSIIAVSITGVAGPGKDDHDHPPGLTYISVVKRTKQQTFQKKFSGNRVELQELFSIALLETLLQCIKTL